MSKLGILLINTHCYSYRSSESCFWVVYSYAYLSIGESHYFVSLRPSPFLNSPLPNSAPLPPFLPLPSSFFPPKPTNAPQLPNARDVLGLTVRL